MKRKSIILFAVLFFYFAGVAQSRYFIVKINGDTLKGSAKISDKNFTLALEDGTSSSINADDIAFIYSPSNSGMVVHCMLHLYSDNIDIVQNGNFVKTRIADTILVLKEIYTTPKMNLYYVQDKDKVPYYFYKKPDDVKPSQLLVQYYIKWLADPELNRNRQGSQFLQQKTYIDQLKMMMQDCEKVSDIDFEQLDYRSYSFIKIIKRYNKCK